MNTNDERDRRLVGITAVACAVALGTGAGCVLRATEATKPGAASHGALLALARERSGVEMAAPAAFVLGPDEHEEFDLSGGKEVRRTVPEVRAFSAGNWCGAVLQAVDGRVEAFLHRDGYDGPILRLNGTSATLQYCQFPTEKNDILVVTRDRTAKGSVAPVEQTRLWDYDSLCALAYQRLPIGVRAAWHVLTAGPGRAEEFQLWSGKEQREVFPYVEPIAPEKARSAGQVLERLKEGAYDVLVYRKGARLPILRLSGGKAKLAASQFPLREGDILWIEGQTSTDFGALVQRAIESAPKVDQPVVPKLPPGPGSRTIEVIQGGGRKAEQEGGAESGTR